MIRQHMEYKRKLHEPYKMTAPNIIPTTVPNPPVNTTPPITAAAIASNSFKFPFAASAVFVSKTCVAAKTVAQS